MPGFELSKNKWGGLTSAYSLSLPLHTGDSASLTTAGGGVETDPAQGIPGHHVWGVGQTTGGSTPQPPGNSNTGVCTRARFPACVLK
jgi:hypothetical protein